MAETVICPLCKTQNQEGDKFCLECGRLLRGEATLVLPGGPAVQGVVSQSNIGQGKKATEPLSKNISFMPRPLKAIFGERFLGNRLIHSDEQQHGYLVTEVVEDESNRIKQCTNPECGAVHGLLNGASESYCTRCSAPLSSVHLALTLFEARTQIFGNAPKVPKLNLAHAGIRAPVAAFQEKVAGESRFCIVTPYSETININIEMDQVYQWGMTLASAFDYLHENNLTYNGQFGEEALSLSNGHVVIASYYDCIIGEKLDEEARIVDLIALAKVLYKWVTGLAQYDNEPGLSPALNKFFEKALNPPGFITARAFSQAFSDASFQSIETRPVNHKLGRLTDVGIARSLNEDSLLTIQVDRFLESSPHPLGVYVVADGMGGHSAGEVASSTIVNTITKDSMSGSLSISEKESSENWCNWINRTVQNANKTVYDLGRKMGLDMGSTLVMAVVDGNIACIGHVGDSRAYKINSQGINSLTKDHSLVERLIDTGQITRDEARTHSQRNVIYRTIGDKEKVDVDTNSYMLNSGDRLLLCSDGLNGMLEDEQIWKIVMEESTPPQTACENLIQAANTAGGDDNITVVIVEIDTYHLEDK